MLYSEALKLQRYTRAMVCYDSKTDTVTRYERDSASDAKLKVTHRGTLDVDAEYNWAQVIMRFVTHPPTELAI